MKEADVQRKFQKLLKEVDVPAKCYKQHGSAFSVAGAPDIIGVYNGVMFVIEFKAPGKLGNVTAKQKVELEAWANLGVIAIVADDADAALRTLAAQSGYRALSREVIVASAEKKSI